MCRHNPGEEAVSGAGILLATAGFLLVVSDWLKKALAAYERRTDAMMGKHHDRP